MQDIAPLVQIVLVVGAVVTPAVLVARLLAGDDVGSFASLLRAPDYTAWPRGVQEEEPVRWRTGQRPAGSAAG